MFAKSLLVVSALLSPLSGLAELSIISDEEMSEMVGQAFVTVEKNPCQTSGLSCTKINFGLKIEAQLNIKKLELGKYDRTGEPDINPAKQGGSFADIDIDNFSLGSIRNDGSINPATITNPFFELAFRNDNDPATRELVGVRLGFEKVIGDLTSTINTLSGAVNMKVWGYLPFYTEIQASLLHKKRATHATGLGAEFPLNIYEELDLVDDPNSVFISLQKESVRYTGGPNTESGFFMNLPSPVYVGVLDVLGGLPRGGSSRRTCHTTGNEESSYVGCY